MSILNKLLGKFHASPKNDTVSPAQQFDNNWRTSIAEPSVTQKETVKTLLSKLGVDINLLNNPNTDVQDFIINRALYILEQNHIDIRKLDRAYCRDVAYTLSN